MRGASIFLSVLLMVVVLAGCGTFTTQTVTFPIRAPSPSIEPLSPALVSAPSPTVVPPDTVTPYLPPGANLGRSPAATTIPGSTPYKPIGTEVELFEYMLNLINQDRGNVGLDPVVLSYNAAAQKHARDMLKNYYISHWGTDGLKPYMRYTLEGGFNYEQENSGYSGFLAADNPDNFGPLNVKEEMRSLQTAMITEEPPNDGHRLNILNKFHKKVNLGIATDGKRLALVQQFEGDYVKFTLPPTLSGTNLALGGRFTLGEINNVAISYDQFPEPLTSAELMAGLHTYSLGPAVGFIIPPPPPGQFYTRLSSKAIVASDWEIDQNGLFKIQADIVPALANGRGVYTVSLIVLVDGMAQCLTNYSIFVN